MTVNTGYQKTSADTIFSWLMSTVGWWLCDKAVRTRGRRLLDMWDDDDDVPLRGVGLDDETAHARMTKKPARSPGK